MRVTCRSIEPNEEEANRKGDPWKRQVEITSIQGKAVEPVIRIEWANFEADSVPKPPAGEISEVWAYEAGSFQGLPDDLLKYLGEHLPQGRGFAFVNRLVAIRKVGPEDQK